MQYWLTTHWPPLKGQFQTYGVYICDGREEAGLELQKGDKVLIYESSGSSASDVLKKYPEGSEEWISHTQGRQGIIAIGELVESLHCDASEPVTQYRDGFRRRWCWVAEGTLVNASGFVSSSKAAALMGKPPGFKFRAIGKRKSGLVPLEKGVYDALVEEFKRNRPPSKGLPKNGPFSPPHPGHGQGGEGPVHEALKEAVFQNPSATLGISGLKGLKKEYPFETGDRADVVLEDFEGRFITVEVKDSVAPDNIAGVLQAVKYKYMFAVKCNRQHEEVRAFLVAHQISKKVQTLCAEYGVECFQVSKQDMPSP